MFSRREIEEKNLAHRGLVRVRALVVLTLHPHGGHVFLLLLPLSRGLLALAAGLSPGQSDHWVSSSLHSPTVRRPVTWAVGTNV